jgi:hypothetical protein
MATLNKMEKEERELIVSLPYRVGVWIGHADDEEGSADDRREHRTVEKILHRFAGQIERYPFISAVLRETLAQKECWERWAGDSLDVLPDCEKALAIVRKTGSSEAVINYRKILMKIANDVAGAHGEFGEFESEGGFTKLISGFFGSKRDDFMNISPSEDEALERLAGVLRLKRRKGE